MEHAYTSACLELLKAGVTIEDVLAGLQHRLQQKGHQRLYGVILRALVRELTRDSADATVLIVARENAVSELKNAIARDQAAGGFNGAHQVRIDPSIIGGFILRDGKKQLDQSYKRKLMKLYRSFS